ncbi:hypothetical protein [Pseudomonas atacamensis]|uniref:hypothetical protein n=1 Tax=Pseudomonas atacamensis TaxID=2565368 RepID=UPI0037F5DAD8
MTDIVKSAAFAVKKTLASKGIQIRHGIALEVIAALLGYRTYAALVTEESDESLQFHLGDAELIVLDQHGAGARLQELGLSEFFVLDDFIQSLVDCRGAVFQSLHEFYDDYAHEAIREVILSSESVIAVMENTTANSPYWVELDDRWRVSGEVWSSIDSWRFEAFGTMDGEHLGTFPDPEDAQQFEDTGEIHCDGWLEFVKAGRSGLKLSGSGGKAD